MYTKLSPCFITLNLATIVRIFLPVHSVPVICQKYRDMILDATRLDLNLLQEILPNNGATLYMPRNTGRPCARATIENFKKELDVLVKENVKNENIYTTAQNVKDSIDFVWERIEGIDEEGNKEQVSRYLSVQDAFQEIFLFLKECYSTQTNSTPCNN